jgi:glutaryl-CoA dehydrogenase (non-decarboxylating)
MRIDLNEKQQTSYNEFRSFVEEHVGAFAERFDQEEQIPVELIKELGLRGYLGAFLPSEFGGGASDALTWGLLCEEVGRGSASLLSLLIVQNMVSQALLKWGSAEHKEKWLPRLASGQTIAAFGLTEPDIGSDASQSKTTAVLDGESYTLNGKKSWISFGQVADLFLIFCRIDGQSTALLVERADEGISTSPIKGMLGFRSAMLAELTMDHCRVPASNIIGSTGFGFSHVAGLALDHGRFSVAWGALGLMEGCIEACLEYTCSRKQFGSFLKDHQLIQAMLADMIVNAKVARQMCCHAAYLKDRGEPSLVMETSIAKFFASKAAVKTALDAVQIHGANGCSDRYPVARYLRDAKIMEIIEGSNQIQQIIIAKYGYQGHLMR